tara:strand:- start:5355 stop:6446 length:1092 start_codon:yes stop_codon:yes gene_type:complete
MIAFILIVSTGAYLAFVSFIIVGLFKHSYQPINAFKESPFISIIIAARNEETYLPNLIQDLVKQEYPTDKLEVIIIDDRSTDSTQEIISEAESNYSFIKQIKITETSQEIMPKKNALTQGINEATGEIILSTDADCRVGKLWVASMAYSIIKNQGISIGYSKVIAHSFFDHYQRIDFLGIIAANTGAGGWDKFWSGTGQNLGYLKRDFELINGFESVKHEVSGDDMYLVQSISKINNAVINIEPASFVTTYGMKTIGEFLNQRIRWASNSKKNWEKEPLFFLFLSLAFSINFSILLSIFLGGNEWKFVFLLKFIFEGITVYCGARLFETQIKLFPYIIWSLAQPFYIPFVAISGILNQYNWKK